MTKVWQNHCKNKVFVTMHFMTFNFVLIFSGNQSSFVHWVFPTCDWRMLPRVMGAVGCQGRGVAAVVQAYLLLQLVTQQCRADSLALEIINPPPQSQSGSGNLSPGAFTRYHSQLNLLRIAISADLNFWTQMAKNRFRFWILVHIHENTWYH